MRNSLKSICRKMNIIIFSYLRYNVLEFNKYTYAKNKKYCKIEIDMIDVNALSENKVYNTMSESIGRDKVKIYE